MSTIAQTQETPEQGGFLSRLFNALNPFTLQKRIENKIIEVMDGIDGKNRLENIGYMQEYLAKAEINKEAERNNPVTQKLIQESVQSNTNMKAEYEETYKLQNGDYSKEQLTEWKDQKSRLENEYNELFETQTDGNRFKTMEAVNRVLELDKKIRELTNNIETVEYAHNQKETLPDWQAMKLEI